MRFVEADKAAWIASILERFEAPLIRHAAGILGDDGRARDVVQETFLELCAARRDVIEPRLPAWLFTVCKNKALDVRKKERRMTTLDPGTGTLIQSPDPAPDERSAQREAASAVLSAIEALPEGQRQVVRLRFQSGLSYREISDTTGHTVNNVGTLLHSALMTLRRRVKV